MRASAIPGIPAAGLRVEYNSIGIIRRAEKVYDEFPGLVVYGLLKEDSGAAQMGGERFLADLSWEKEKKGKMGRNAGFFGAWVMVFACLTGAFVLVTQVMVHAQPGIVEVEGGGYNVNASMADNLKALTGKKVSFTLDSGKTLTGSVKAVGGQLLHLEKLEGKEFFDALVRLEDISAVDTRIRGERR